MKIKVVIDTNVILSGLMSKKGASFRLLDLIPKNKLIISVSVPLLLEYEAVLYKNIKKLKLTKQDIDDFLDYFCSVAEKTKIYYLWRPILKDAYDDHLLELAVSSNSKYIVTYNIKDFNGSDKFGIDAVMPDVILKKSGC